MFPRPRQSALQPDSPLGLDLRLCFSASALGSIFTWVFIHFETLVCRREAEE